MSLILKVCSTLLEATYLDALPTEEVCDHWRELASRAKAEYDQRNDMVRKLIKERDGYKQFLNISEKLKKEQENYWKQANEEVQALRNTIKNIAIDTNNSELFSALEESKKRW